MTPIIKKVFSPKLHIKYDICGKKRWVGLGLGLGLGLKPNFFIYLVKPKPMPNLNPTYY
jgi:hypothetical protein